MIQFSEHTLKNGLRLLVHEDDSTPLVAVNMLYHVGAKDDDAERTGFAHLLEHLMFSGSANMSDFDSFIQTAGGDSNAFTNSDITNYYTTIPASNLEALLWLEADRMCHLVLNERSLEVQRKVVVEEFNETCLNIPYGMAWHQILALAYKKHPYRWATIGLTPQHIENAKLEDVRRFYKKYYAPNNAILVVAGNVKTTHIIKLVNQHFGDIPRGIPIPKNNIIEPPQESTRRQKILEEIPLNALYMAFHTVDRMHPDYYAIDLLSDILCNGKSSRLYKKLKKKLKYFVEIDAYVTGNFQAGMVIIEGKLVENISFETAEQSIFETILEIQEDISEQELQKYKNKAISGLLFNECNLMNRAMTLAYYATLGNAQKINKETQRYQSVTTADIRRVAETYLRSENCSILQYCLDENAD